MSDDATSMGGRTMVGLPGERMLPRRAHRQPQPCINEGGDCGGCCLGGALGISVAEAYARLSSDGITSAHEMARCLRCAVGCELADRILDTPSEWPSARHWHSFGSPAFLEYIPWFNHVRMAVDAGYYGLAEVDFSGNAYPDTNHWVLICGARTAGNNTGHVITGEILISCSVRGESWMDAREFLKSRGGYATLFVRPSQQ